MPIPSRFSQHNPARDQLMADAANLPASEKAQIEAALPGGSPSVSLAMPGQPQQAIIGSQGENLSGGILDRLKKFCTATKGTAQQDENLFLSKGLISVSSGYAVITAKGIGYLVDFGLL